ncbi:hypothetical protein Tco_0133807 [Tanacetum coccineum]
MVIKSLLISQNPSTTGHSNRDCVPLVMVPLNNNIGKQIGDFVDTPSEAVEQGMDANVPDEIDGAKGEQVPTHVVKKGNLEFLVCKEIANPVLMN